MLHSWPKSQLWVANWWCHFNKWILLPIVVTVPLVVWTIMEPCWNAVNKHVLYGKCPKIHKHIWNASEIQNTTTWASFIELDMNWFIHKLFTGAFTQEVWYSWKSCHFYKAFVLYLSGLRNPLWNLGGLRCSVWEADWTLFNDTKLA